MLPSTYPSSITQTASRSVQPFGRVSSSMLGHVFLSKNCPSAPSHGVSGPPSNTRFLQPTGSRNPNDISIGSAVFVQIKLLTAECCRAYRDMPFSLKIPPSHRDLDPHLTRGSFGPPDSASQTPCRSIHLSAVLHRSRQTVPILYNGRPFLPSKLQVRTLLSWQRNSCTDCKSAQ